MSSRDPIARIKSLYWYEHVEWYYKIVKKSASVRSYETWVEAWLDGSSWKNDFVRNNPGNNYMEIDNYYVKTLVGWSSGQGVVGEKELARAKRVLEAFDLVLITEWMHQKSQVELLDAWLKVGRSPSIKFIAEVKNSTPLKKTLKHLLADNEVSCLLSICRVI